MHLHRDSNPGPWNTAKVVQEQMNLVYQEQHCGHEHVKTSVKDKHNSSVGLLRCNNQGMTDPRGMKVMLKPGEKCRCRCRYLYMGI